MKTRISIAIVTFLILMSMLVSCGGSGIVDIKVSEIKDYPIFTISNSHGNDIVIKPVSDTIGSIGYESDGKTIWLAGEPEMTKESDGTISYTWDVGTSDKVELRVSQGEDETDLHLGLAGGKDLEMPGRWFINTEASEDEYFTGLFERVVDGPQGNSWQEGIETAMNLRNERVIMKLQPTVSAYSPFYISSENYGFCANTTWPGLFDICKAIPDIVQIEFEGPDLDFKYYLNESPKEIIQKHTLETGPPFLPPRWAFGPWRWRDDHYNNETYFDGSEVTAPYNSDIVEDVLMMQEYGIPCTAYWIDRPWGPGNFGYDDFEIDYERLPNFEDMITWLNGKNMELMLWICPWAYGDMADVAEEKGYGLVARGQMRMGSMMPPPGGAANMQFPGMPPDAQQDNAQANRQRMQMRQQREPEKYVVMDFTNEEAAQWWGEKGPGKLASMGVKGFKLDRADGERLVDSLNLKTASGISYRENYNNYAHQFVKATFEAVQPVLGDNFVLFPRAQFTGSSRYGTMWAGDTDNSPEGLRSALIAMQRCAVMGYPLWSSDAGGYPKRIQKEVTMRWIGFSCFSPVMEIGPTNNLGFWGLNMEPSYDHELLAVWHFYTNLRMSLVDYVYNLAKEASETGMPVARPLFMEYPDQEESWNDWRSYKLGDDLLVSVVWENGKTSQEVYLPSGETWINLWNNEEYEGGQYVSVDTPLHQTPLFLRKGSTLSLPDLSKMYEESVATTSVKLKMSDLEAEEDWK